MPNTRYVGASRFNQLMRVLSFDAEGWPNISDASDRGFRRFPWSRRKRELRRRQVRDCVHVWHGGSYWTDCGKEYWSECKRCGWQGTE